MILPIVINADVFRCRMCRQSGHAHDVSCNGDQEACTGGNFNFPDCDDKVLGPAPARPDYQKVISVSLRCIRASVPIPVQRSFSDPSLPVANNPHAQPRKFLWPGFLIFRFTSQLQSYMGSKTGGLVFTTSMTFSGKLNGTFTSPGPQISYSTSYTH